MRRSLRLLLVAILALVCFAQSGGLRVIGPTYVPNVSADAVTGLVTIDSITLTNNTAGNLTVRIRDKSTACNGGPCPLVPDDLVVNATSIYTIAMYGMPARGGITWVASAANSVVGKIRLVQ